MCIWNPNAINYSVGVDIYHPETDTYYTEQHAQLLPDWVQSQLVLKGRKLGTWVLSMDDLKIINNRKV